MTKAIPTIQKYMTTSPHSIGSDQTLAKAQEMMHSLGIRHLPVLSGGHIVGMLSDRDLRLIESMDGVDSHKVKVDEAMEPNVYSVSPDAALDEVVVTMGEKKYGSTVVVQNGKVVGIFTTVDLCRAFAELLHTRLAK
jgi:acetoin utilization protein AcuB